MFTAPRGPSPQSTLWQQENAFRFQKSEFRSQFEDELAVHSLQEIYILLRSFRMLPSDLTTKGYEVIVL